jgi:predicted metalloprotease with PDZ domain
MLVSKLDEGSEAKGAGVQVGDQLVLLNDCDIRFEPFKETLDKVRMMSACKLTFVPCTAF